MALGIPGQPSSRLDAPWWPDSEGIPIASTAINTDCSPAGPIADLPT
jgi:hypothetical protein